MQNRRLFIVFSAFVVGLIVILVGHAFFSVGNVFAHNINLPQSDERVEQFNRKIEELGVVRHGQSMFVLNESSIAATIEAAFVEAELDIVVSRVERVFPRVVYIHYEIPLIEFQIIPGHQQYEGTVPGGRFVQMSRHGRVLNISDEEYSGQAFDILWSGINPNIEARQYVDSVDFFFAVDFIFTFITTGFDNFILSEMPTINLNSMHDGIFELIFFDGEMVFYNSNDFVQDIESAMEELNNPYLGEQWRITVRDGVAVSS